MAQQKPEVDEDDVAVYENEEQVRIHRLQHTDKGDLRRAKNHVKEALDRLERARSALENSDVPDLQVGTTEDFDHRMLDAHAVTYEMNSSLRDEYEERKNGKEKEEFIIEGDN